LECDLFCVTSATTQQAQHHEQAQSSQQAGTSSSSAISFTVPLGMSEYGFKRVNAGNPLTSEELEQVCCRFDESLVDTAFCSVSSVGINISCLCVLEGN
jgi:hypothetical protein